MSFGVSMKMKSMFFDRKAVEDALSRAKRQELSKAGAHIRQVAKTSMRKRKKPSPPGQPPSVHVGDLRRLIWFAYDPINSSVVVGPLRFKKGEAPALNEFGGTAPRDIKVFRRHRGQSGGHAAVQIKRVTARYPKRPFMGPALLKVLPTVSKRWAGAVRPA